MLGQQRFSPTIAYVTFSLPTGNYDITLPVHRVFAVTGGTAYNFYLNAISLTTLASQFSSSNMILEFYP